MQLVRLQEDALGDPHGKSSAGQQSGTKRSCWNWPDQERGRGADRARSHSQALEDETTLWKSMADTAAGFFGSVPERSQRVRSAVGSGEDRSSQNWPRSCWSSGCWNIDVSGGGVMGALGSILGGSSGRRGLIETCSAGCSVAVALVADC